MIEEQESDEIIRDIKDMLRSFRIKTYDEDTGYGLLRHVLVRKGLCNRSDNGSACFGIADTSIEE